jgi:hypothetical protein
MSSSSRDYSRPDTTHPVSLVLWNGDGTIKAPYHIARTRLASRQTGHYTGRRTPHYVKVRNEGKMLPLNAYSRSDYRATTQVGSRTWENLENGSGGSNPQISYETWLMLSESEASESLDGVDPFEGVNTDALVIAAMADILPDLDALTTAVEARKTVDMVVNARKDAIDLIQTALRGGKYTVKAASDAWLAWRYGWEQLGRDVANCYDLLNDPVTHLVVTGQSGLSKTSSPSRSGIKRHLADEGYFNLSWSASIDHSVRARVVARWSSRTLNVVADPAITMWETIPYSFVADWFVNVGDVLAGWKVQNNCSTIYASLGWKSTIDVLTTERCVPNAGYSHTGQWGWSESYRSRGRVPASIPSLVPSFTVNLTSKRILDAAALLGKRIL